MTPFSLRRVALAPLFLALAAMAGPCAAQDAPAQPTPAQSTPVQPVPGPVADVPVALDPALAAVIADGQRLYLKNCRTCHGSKGTAGVPLAGNAKVQGDYGYLVWAILTGPGYMPEFGPALSDEQIAGIATYILNSWGNDYGLVSPADVHDQR